MPRASWVSRCSWTTSKRHCDFRVAHSGNYNWTNTSAVPLGKLQNDRSSKACWSVIDRLFVPCVHCGSAWRDRTKSWPSSWSMVSRLPVSTLLLPLLADWYGVSIQFVHVACAIPSVMPSHARCTPSPTTTIGLGMACTIRSP